MSEVFHRLFHDNELGLTKPFEQLGKGKCTEDQNIQYNNEKE